ncbi:MAG: hypothetical protein SAJ37_15375 [Oscillatoria sp. PMC 1068.18]|nr:hypothetical protein [Oscillatoria sp. PMC 1076.18]MEC4990113.1 hypothetical protein [Oscillatoria sp. PMC 1068.18]
MRYLLTFLLIYVLNIFAFRPGWSPVLAQTNPQLNNNPTCPTDVKILTEQMLKDLPSYANRVIQRARRLNREVDIFSYVILAGKAEFEPLTLGPGEYNTAPNAIAEDPPQQIFFTTLERQYTDKQAIETQHYHWLFLVQTNSGWRVVTIFSRLGSPSPERPPLPPRETSKGVIGQAVKLWLRDCRAGTLRN